MGKDCCNSNFFSVKVRIYCQTVSPITRSDKSEQQADGDFQPDLLILFKAEAIHTLLVLAFVRAAIPRKTETSPQLHRIHKSGPGEFPDEGRVAPLDDLRYRVTPKAAANYSFSGSTDFPGIKAANLEPIGDLIIFAVCKSSRQGKKRREGIRRYSEGEPLFVGLLLFNFYFRSC